MKDKKGARISTTVYQTTDWKSCTQKRPALFPFFKRSVFHLSILVESYKDRSCVPHVHHHEIHTVLNAEYRQSLYPPMEVHKGNYTFHERHISYIPTHKPQSPKKPEPPPTQLALIIHECHVQPERKAYVRLFTINIKQVLVYKPAYRPNVFRNLSGLVLPAVQDQSLEYSKRILHTLNFNVILLQNHPLPADTARISSSRKWQARHRTRSAI